MLRSKYVGVLVVSVVCFAFAAAPALAAPETPTTEAAEVSGTTATLKGVLNPGAAGEAGSYEFLYKLSATECEGESATPSTPTVGGQAEPVSAEVLGLQPSVTYAFCLLAHNEAGEPAISAIETLTTPAAPPTIVGESVEGVTGTAATLVATTNPNNQETTYKFEYSTEATGETLEGTIVEAPGSGPLSGFGEQRTETRAESLSPHTLYYYRVVATNASNETTTGKVETFPTATPPETPTIEPVELEGLTAKLKGVLNPNAPGEAGFYEFFYRLSLTECQGEGEASTGQEGATGEQAEHVSFNLTGLQPSMTYSFCLLARNSVGETAVSSVETVTTAPSPPAINAEISSGMTSTAAALFGEINPNNQETNYTFEYSTQATEETLEGTITKIPGSSPLPSVFGNQPVEAKPASLQPRTQYFWRIAATNVSNEEAIPGKVESFKTLDKPLVTTGAAQGITRTTASISGTVDPGGLATRSHFVYVDDPHYNSGALECPEGEPCAYGEGAKTTPSELLGESDYSPHAVGPHGLEELKPGTTYHYALIATNSEGTRITADKTFKTSPATPPSASTGEATGVTQLSATLSGIADTHGLPGTLSFAVALSPEGGSLEPASVVEGSQSGTSVGITFSFGNYLQPGTTYYFRAVATNADGTAEGAWRSFTTSTFPSPFPPTVSFPLLTIPAEAKETSGSGTSKPLTNAQKLKKALKACHKLKKKSSKRAKCERTARHKYAAKRKK